MVSYLKVNLKTNFVFGLVSLDCRLRLLEYFFLSHFLKKETALFLLPVSRTCSMPRQDVFGFLSFAQSCKILSKIFKTFRHFKTQRETLCNDDVNRASVL